MTKSAKNANNQKDKDGENRTTDEHPKNYGLSTSLALSRLHDEIQNVLDTFESKNNAESLFWKTRSAFVKRYDSPLGWLAISFSFITIIGLLIIENYLAAIFLTSITLLDLFIVVRENNLRRTEIYRKTRRILEEIKLAEEEFCGEWQTFNYPHLCCPISPCVSLQWTYRDGVIVNLPWALLVRGDDIVLRPGHIAPGPCTDVNGKKSFNTHEIYGVAKINDPPTKPVARAPFPDLVCTLQNTPYLDNLKIILENSLKRPPTIYNQQRYLLVTKYIQQWGFLCAATIVVLAGILRFHGFEIPLSENRKSDWLEIFVEAPITSVISLLPLFFPIMWVSMNLWGVARLNSFMRTPQTYVTKDSQKSFEEDLDTPSCDYENVNLLRANIFRLWIKLWKGDSELLPRSANVVQVLGSVTALCCVDKKGILSWPNPTAEKVFFLHDFKDDKLDGGTESSTQTDGESDDQVNKNEKVKAEVLDLTHDQHCPFRLEFDDPEWKAHIKSLKPLGLSILLNTCSPLTHAHYAQFCGHVTAVAMLDKDLVPVTNRYEIVESSSNCFLHGRCLCELAKQIGFTDHATTRFNLEGQLATYRHLQPDVVRRDIRFARHLQISSKVKVPFPHSLSVVMRESPDGCMSLFTQGTADIILDCCDDFWDGKDLRPLSQHDRKRALDFYQRSALTAYCTAFAYRPLRHGINGSLGGSIQNKNISYYLELPPESKYRMQHVDKTHCDFEENVTKLSHSISTDSLLFSETKKKSCNYAADGNSNDVNDCFEMQCHQVFIGMITMQYQAQTDVVQLIERLERACIRFVHFSKENELRSRVFSEKMGLESGWNCHISLLSEADAQSLNAASIGGGAAASHSPKNSGNFEFIVTTSLNNSCNEEQNAHADPISGGGSGGSGGDCGGGGGDDGFDNNEANNQPDLSFKLQLANLETSKTLSSSAPGAISDQDYNVFRTNLNSQSCGGDGDAAIGSSSNIAASKSSLNDGKDHHHHHHHHHQGEQQQQQTSSHHRQSEDSALDDNCRSLSILTDSTDQSAPVHYNFNNKAKLPRGICNIRPHLEQVDNVPLQVSLFTDCSAEATREMLSIMQSYGEIVVCLGSSASNANAEIFLQADCSIAIEPLHPQVCQNIPAYSEQNILNNKLRLLKFDDSERQHILVENGCIYDSKSYSAMQLQQNNSTDNTISPIYLSRLLNSLPCSISTKREDDALSIIAIIQLTRRFSLGLWNCIQYWACCAGTLAVINILSAACLSLPAILMPINIIYIMCIPIPLISLSLAHIQVDPKIMNRATGKKHTEYNSRVFGFVIWCYGLKFITPILIMMLSYCAFMAHPIRIIDIERDNIHNNLNVARINIFMGIIIHLVIVSSSFVHRDHSIWQKNPLTNRIWAFNCLIILLLHTVIYVFQLIFDKNVYEEFDTVWPVTLFMISGGFISLIVAEICKWQEIKVNTRYQRRARLDFGTKLGMNSPF